MNRETPEREKSEQTVMDHDSHLVLALWTFFTLGGGLLVQVVTDLVAR